MKAKWLAGTVFSCVIGLAFSFAYTAQAPEFPQPASFTTRHITPFAIEGLTMDATGNFYTTGRQTDTTKRCPVWRINPSGSTRVSVGFIPNSAASPCNPSGITFDSVGNLYIGDAAQGGVVWKVTPNATGCASDDSAAAACAAIVASNVSSPNAPFASGAPGANGLAFDLDGNLWTGDGVTGRGRVWRITGAGANCNPSALSNCQEVFRIQPMRNGTDLGGDISVVPTANQPTQGVGRSANTFPHTAAGGNPQDLVANGVAFDPTGRRLFVADTARGAIWRVELEQNGSLESQTNCDTTFTANTLCLNNENLFVVHPLLDGADGIALDINGNIWVDANERNAVVVVSSNGQVFEVFRNPVNNNNLRNSATNLADNDTILEFPTSPFLNGTTFCTANSDGNRRDNFPQSGGEVNQVGPVGARGKISCMNEPLLVPGLPLPIQP